MKYRCRNNVLVLTMDRCRRLRSKTIREYSMVKYKHKSIQTTKFFKMYNSKFTNGSSNIKYKSPDSILVILFKDIESMNRFIMEKL